MLITLTTDFGTSDWFVGSMKGVISGIAPATRIIDITHKVPPGDLVDGAFALAASAPYFPAGTIHIAVVDPGVGSARRAITLRTQRAIFIGPDNGVLSWALREEQIEEVRILNNENWFLKPVSHTFHGRDIFAPAAAHLAAGARFDEAGDPTEDFVRLPWPEVTEGENEMRGEVIYIDRFGNAISNLPASSFPPELLASSDITATCGGPPAPMRHCYTDVHPGKPVAILGSSGLLELAINGDDFAEQNGIEVGAPVYARW
ncbi:MAG: SAM-dependent chlorinase/fluorinase [Roseibacillus sp.]|nr:SAM-dependent chlorinase/fluorinase [Roseibacillus sp.]